MQDSLPLPAVILIDLKAFTMAATLREVQEWKLFEDIMFFGFLISFSKWAEDPCEVGGYVNKYIVVGITYSGSGNVERQSRIIRTNS